MRCDYKGSIRDDRIKEQVNEVLKIWLENPDPELFTLKDETKLQSNPDAIRLELKDIDVKMNRLVDLQLSVAADDALQQQYASRLHDLSDQKRIKTRALALAEVEKEANNPREFIATIARIKEIGLSVFWSLETPVINQELMKLVGKSRFLIDVRAGKLRGVGKVKIGRTKY